MIAFKLFFIVEDMALDARVNEKLCEKLHWVWMHDSNKNSDGRYNCYGCMGALNLKVHT